MNPTDDPEREALRQLTHIFVDLARHLVAEGEAPPARVHNAMATAALAEMVLAVGAEQVADWLRRTADSVENIDESVGDAGVLLQ